MNNTQDIQLPKYFEQLSSEDQKSYLDLRSYLSSKECRNNRGRRLTKFSEILNSIQNFCLKKDKDDVKRCMVCGVCWLPPKGLAINIRQLHLLLDKCKSSINGSLQRMGYNPLPPKNDLVNQLIDFIPNLKNNFSELREWTIRTLTLLTPQPEIISMNQSFNFQNPQVSKYQNDVNNSKVNNDFNNMFYNNKNIPTSISTNSLSDIQNIINKNAFSAFSSPQPNVFMNQFVQPQQPITNQFIPQSQSFTVTPQNNVQQNTEVTNNSCFDEDIGIDNYFNDPFCLPPSSLFDDENGFGFQPEATFDSWANESQF